MSEALTQTRRLLILRAFALFLDLVGNTLVAAPLQHVFPTLDELVLYWLTYVVAHIFFMRDLEATPGMKLVGITLRDFPPGVAWRLWLWTLMPLTPAIIGLWLGVNLQEEPGYMTAAALLVALPALEWLRAFVGLGPTELLWDRAARLRLRAV